MGTTVTPPLGAATLVENPIGAAMRKPNRHRGVLPALHWQDAPAAVLAEALEARTALFSVTGASGSGKTVWAEQLDEAARAWSRTHADRWRVVHVSATKHDHQVPFALARRIIVTAGGARPDPDAETDPDSDAAINGTANDCRRTLSRRDCRAGADCCSSSTMRSGSTTLRCRCCAQWSRSTGRPGCASYSRAARRARRRRARSSRRRRGTRGARSAASTSSPSTPRRRAPTSRACTTSSSRSPSRLD